MRLLIFLAIMAKNIKRGRGECLPGIYSYSYEDCIPSDILSEDSEITESEIITIEPKTTQKMTTEVIPISKYARALILFKLKFITFLAKPYKIKAR